MAGQYDYTVNIPQPPAQNFLQSLLGIQQLKGLQQQQELSQQQAGIQQQQAQFAQERQPLELAQMRAAEKSALASAASSESMTNARNYDLGKQKELDTRLQWLSKSENFTVDNLQQAAVEFHKYDPTLFVRAGEIRKAIPAEGQLFLDKTSEKLLFAGVTGKKDDALSVLDESIKAAEGSDKFKQYVPQLQDLRTKIDENPEKTQSLIAMSQIVFRGDKGKSVIEQIGELAKTKKIEAETKKEDAAQEGLLLDNRIKQYEADNGISLADIQKNKDKIFEVEAAERAHVESNPFVRKYIDSRTAFEMMKEAAPNASGDETLLTQFVKMGDPGSVVSVTEKGGVKNVTLSDYIGSLQAKLANNGSLSDAKRKELKDQAFKMLQAPQKQYKEYQSNLEPVYRKRNLDPKNIFVLPSSEQLLEDAKKQAAGPAGAPGLPISTGNIPVATSGLNPVQAEMLRRGLPLNK